MRKTLTAVYILTLVAAFAPALADCDVTPPQLTDFDFSPAAVDVITSPNAVTCEMTLTDALAGVDEATCSFRAPGFLQVQSCTATSPSSGTRNDGVFSCVVGIPRYAESGTWRASIIATDATGNVRQVSDVELEFVLALPVDLTVTSTPDVTPPVLTSFDFNPKTPDVSGGTVNVGCSLDVTDALAGVNRIACFFQSPSDEFGYACFAFFPSSGNRNNGTFSCNVPVERYSEAGDWTALVAVYDEVENVAFFDGATLQGMGYPSTLAVASSPEDAAAPVLTNFDFSPKAVDVAGAPRIVGCSMDVTDDLAGVSFISCTFDAPGLQHRAECLATTPSVGSATNGTFVCSLVIPQHAPGGDWKASVEILDRVGNVLEEDATTLAVAGFPTDLAVDCGTAFNPFTIDFANHTTILWNPVTDALFYNVYRGDLAGLDLSYGTCQTANDPNPTDTTYIDTEDPLSGQGFAYLVSYRLIAGEEGIGSRSDGTPRVIVPACP